MSNPAPRIAEPILVTGATGFIGRHLMRRLLNEGYRLSGFDLPNSKIPAEWNVTVDMCYGDIANRDDVARAMQNVRTVFHLAAMVGDWGARELFDRVTIQGSRNLYETASANNAHVILASSLVVYGEHIGESVCNEDTPFGKYFGDYSRCKQAQEILAWEFQRNRHMQLTVVRLANVYGPWSRPWVDFVADTVRSGLPCLINGGDFNAGLVYIHNLIDILMLVAAEPRALGRVYHGYDDNPTTWAQYFTDIARIVGAPKPKAMPEFIARIAATTMETTWRWMRSKSRPIVTWEGLNLARSNHRLSTARLRDELGYTPHVSYPEALRAIEAYLRERGWAK